MKRKSIPASSYNSDRKYIREKEILFSQKSEFAEENSAKEKPREVSQEELVDIWKNEKRENPGNQMELLAMVFFHKFFSKEFMVVRTSLFDDYAHSVDMVVVNRKTGTVICAFDDVIGRPKSDTVADKNTKLENKFGRNGTTLKYGFRVTQENHRLALAEKQIEHLPLLPLRVTPNEFDDLFEAVVANPSEKPSRREIGMMKQMLDRLLDQCRELEKKNLDPSVRENLRVARASLVQMKDLVNKNTF